MAHGGNPLDVVEVLARRIDVVEQFLDGPVEKRVLVDRLDSSRTTVDRAVRELEAHGILERADGGHRITRVGEVVVTDWLAFVERVRAARDLSPLLRWLPLSSLDLDLAYLMDADVVATRPNDPCAMVNRHVAALEDADRFRAALPLVGLHGARTLRDRVVDAGCQVTMVLQSGAAETVRTSPEYRTAFEEMAATDRCDLFVYEGSLPYYLGIVDGVVQIGVDEDGEPRALAETDRAEVVAWAEASFAQCLDRSSPLPL